MLTLTFFLTARVVSHNIRKKHVESKDDFHSGINEDIVIAGLFCRKLFNSGAVSRTKTKVTALICTSLTQKSGATHEPNRFHYPDDYCARV